MAQIQLLIGGVDYTSCIEMESVSVDNNVIMTSDSASLIMQLDGELPRPRTGQEFIWRTIEVGPPVVEVGRDFGGVVVNVEESTDGPSLIYNITIKSYVHWFDRHLVVAWYAQDYPDEIIKEMVASFCPGFTTNNVQHVNTQVIPQYFNYSKPSTAIKMIADQIEHGWYIDYFKDVHFYPVEFFVSPLPGNILDADRDMTSYGNLVIAENGEQVFNKIILKGFKVRSVTPISLGFPCDGITAQWSLGYRASSIKNDVKMAYFPSQAAYASDTSFLTTGVPTNGTALTVKKDIIQGAPDMPSESGAGYIHYTQHLVRVPNATGNNQPLPTGNVVGVWFYYLKDQIFMGQDLAAQGTIAKIEGTDGVYEYSHEDKSLTNSTIGAPQAKAQLMLRKYGLPQIQGSFVSYLSGWRAGQYFMLMTNKRMGVLRKVMYVHRVKKKIVNNINGQSVVQSTIQFADSPYLV